MNFYTHIFQGFWLDFKLLFVVLFLGIISKKGVSCSSGEGVVFQIGGASFLNGEHPMGASVFVGRFEKKRKIRECPPMPPTMGNPAF